MLDKLQATAALRPGK